MARIRTIKPEFPQSESMGRVSRDARLLFIQLWTQADDAGRLRGASRMLASLLFPYDDDAPGLIDGWLDELDRQGCLRLYRKDGHTYVEITNWLEHQKIDKPSKSKFPPFDDASRVFAKPREPSSLDQGLRIKEGTEDQGPGEVVADATPPAKPPALVLTGDDDLADMPAHLVRGELGDAVEAWNAMAKRTGLPAVQTFTEKRRRALKGRLAECGGLDGWRSAMERVEASPFLRGERSGNGHDRWRATFDFVVTQGNFTKLMEGNYDDRQAASTAASQREILEAVGLAGGMAGG